jgi:hypothetical protein
MIRINKFIVISIIVAFGITFGQSLARAEKFETIIEDGSYFAQPIPFQSGDSLTISYMMEVTQDVTLGPFIDVYFVNSSNFIDYKDGRQFSFNPDLSEEHTKNTSNELTITSQDNYYLIFDNTDNGATQPPNDVPVGQNTAIVTYNITTTPHFSNTGNDGSKKIPGFELILIFIAITLILLWSQRRITNE